MRVVVLGGYGNFGARICRALARDNNLEIIVAGRDPEQGCREAQLSTHIGRARVDYTDPNLISVLRDLKAELVIHCIGPFQGQDYHVALASLEAGAHYIDLADGRDFVLGFSKAVNSLAQSNNRCAITGASTVPALSSAVVDAFIAKFTTLEKIHTVIAPAQRAPRGSATLKAVFSYVGKPFNWWVDGAWHPVYGWQELQRLHLKGLGSRWAAACDIPDLALFPPRYPTLRNVEFRAALELGIEHLALWSVAALRRIGLPVPIENCAGLLDQWATQLNRFGSERGGMWVGLEGLKNNNTLLRIDWHLTADQNHGPEIPAMAAILLTRKLAQDKLIFHGAAPCMGFLTLEEFASEFAHWDIRTEVEERILS